MLARGSIYDLWLISDAWWVVIIFLEKRFFWQESFLDSKIKKNTCDFSYSTCIDRYYIVWMNQVEMVSLKPWRATSLHFGAIAPPWWSHYIVIYRSDHLWSLKFTIGDQFSLMVMPGHHLWSTWLFIKQQNWPMVINGRHMIVTAKVPSLTGSPLTAMAGWSPLPQCQARACQRWTQEWLPPHRLLLPPLRLAADSSAGNLGRT